MPRGFPALTAEQKALITRRVKEDGERVADLAKEYGVTTKTIYRFLGRKANTSNTILELARLKRENEVLLKIIGQLTYEKKLKKNVK